MAQRCSCWFPSKNPQTKRVPSHQLTWSLTFGDSDHFPFTGTHRDRGHVERFHVTCWDEFQTNDAPVSPKPGLGGEARATGLGGPGRPFPAQKTPFRGGSMSTPSRVLRPISGQEIGWASCFLGWLLVAGCPFVTHRFATRSRFPVLADWRQADLGIQNHPQWPDPSRCLDSWVASPWFPAHGSTSLRREAKKRRPALGALRRAPRIEAAGLAGHRIFVPCALDVRKVSRVSTLSITFGGNKKSSRTNWG